MLESVRDFIFNNLLYRMRDERPELDKLRFQIGSLPLVFAVLPESIIKGLQMIRRRSPRLEVTEINFAWNGVINPYTQPALTSSYRNRSLLISAPEWAKQNIGMKRSIFVSNSMMYLQSTLIERKM